MPHTVKTPFRYRGRMLKAGAPFPGGRETRVLEAIGKIEVVENGSYSAPAPSRATKGAKGATGLRDDDGNGKPGGSRRQPPAPELVAARADYKRATGKNWFSGWSVSEIRAKIAAHKAGPNE